MATNLQSAALLLTNSQTESDQLRQLTIKLIQLGLTVFNCLNINSADKNNYARIFELSKNYYWLIEVNFTPLPNCDVYLNEIYTLRGTDAWQLGMHIAYQGHRVIVRDTLSFTPVQTLLHHCKRVLTIHINSSLSNDKQNHILDSIAVGIHRLTRQRNYILDEHLPIDRNQELEATFELSSKFPGLICNHYPFGPAGSLI